MATYLICHGAWSAGWAWKKMRPLLQAAGHEVFIPTYTGLGERAHLAHPLVDLETHIQDVLGVAEYEGLQDVILVGHSYGGMVATGVADRAPGLVRQLVYLDAWPTWSPAAPGRRRLRAGCCRPTPRRRIPRRRTWNGLRRAAATSRCAASPRKFA